MATPVSETSSAVIDERRAQQLRERAMNLAERNELASAVLACRQAIALSPQASQSYSMLGLLLERAGDGMGAIAAYEKVLEFAPDSFLERESLSRLRGAASQRQNTREMFAFDDNELFGESTADALPTVARADSGSTSDAKTASQKSATKSADNEAAPVVIPEDNSSNKTAASGAVVTTASAATPTGSTPGASASKSGASVPASSKPSTPSNRSNTMPFPSTQSPSRPSTAGLGVPLEFSTPPVRAAKQSAWQRLKQRPTPYFRGLPLAGATAIGLVFLLWANNYASSNRAAGGSQAAPYVTENPFDNPAPNAPQNGPSPANPALTNQPATTGATSGNTAATPGNSGTATAPGSATANPGAPAANSVPTRSSSPAATTSAAPGSTPGAPTTNSPGNVPAPATSSSPGVAPSNTGGASVGGAPVAPGGSPNPDYVRVAPVGGAPVSRPENRAATDERNARNDAQAGRSNSAIDNLSRAIESGGPDVAMRYQSRAQLYLQSNDGARASSDFQAAISAYNDMVARGDRVQIAQAGISACRRGLQMAQARR